MRRNKSLALKGGEVLLETGCNGVWARRTPNQRHEMLQVSFRNVLYRLQQSSEHELLPVLDGSFTVGDFTPGIEFGIEIAKGIGSFADITWTWAAATLCFAPLASLAGIAGPRLCCSTLSSVPGRAIHDSTVTGLGRGYRV